MKKVEPKPLSEGWTYLSNNPKWHYFRGGRSLCGRWLLFNTDGLEQGNNNSPDNCSSCRKKLETENRRADSGKGE